MNKSKWLVLAVLVTSGILSLVTFAQEPSDLTFPAPAATTATATTANSVTNQSPESTTTPIADWSKNAPIEIQRANSAAISSDDTSSSSDTAPPLGTTQVSDTSAASTQMSRINQQINSMDQLHTDHTLPPQVRPKDKALTKQDFGNTDLSRQAFVQMLHNVMPLSPEQIVTLHKLFDQTQRAVAKYPGTPPKPTSSSLRVNMSPGSTPPVIRLRAGYITSLVFLDSTGQPWPIVGYDLGDPKAFNIQPNAPDGKSNTLLVQTTSSYRAGNLAVMLKGQSTPVMLTLMPGQRAVDYRVDLRVPGLGPNAVVTMNDVPSTENPQMLNFLDGVPPSGAKLLHVSGAQAQAWLYCGHIFLRTRVTVLSPGWISSVNSPDGTHVYEINKTPVILASKRGEMVELSIKGF